VFRLMWPPSCVMPARYRYWRRPHRTKMPCSGLWNVLCGPDWRNRARRFRYSASVPTNQGTAGMADDVLENAGPAPETGKVKRAPPTIDLEATKVSETASAETGSAEAKSAENKSAENKSTENEPAESKPAETGPASEPRHEAELGSQPQKAAASAR